MFLTGFQNSGNLRIPLNSASAAFNDGALQNIDQMVKLF